MKPTAIHFFCMTWGDILIRFIRFIPQRNGIIFTKLTESIATLEIPFGIVLNLWIVEVILHPGK